MNWTFFWCWFLVAPLVNAVGWWLFYVGWQWGSHPIVAIGELFESLQGLFV